ncbi:hypothetical protein RIF29_20968 [Crotalaria pallida]|uniref:Uncharacterized protein n=1 Tax=Crotalaria pallida TaxID=3830 RepID=A0AAN9F2B6_CROPI
MAAVWPAIVRWRRCCRRKLEPWSADLNCRGVQEGGNLVQRKLGVQEGGNRGAKSNGAEIEKNGELNMNRDEEYGGGPFLYFSTGGPLLEDRRSQPKLANKQRRWRGKGVSGSGRRRRRLIPDRNGTAVLVVPSVLVGDRGKVADRTEQRWIERREEANNRLDRAERSLIPVCCVAPPPSMGVGITNRLPPVTDPLASLSPWAAAELKPSLAFPLVANRDSILAAKTEPPPCALSLLRQSPPSLSLPLSRTLPLWSPVSSTGSNRAEGGGGGGVFLW